MISCGFSGSRNSPYFLRDMICGQPKATIHRFVRQVCRRVLLMKAPFVPLALWMQDAGVVYLTVKIAID
jgi:hypothetical protein